MNRKVIIMGAGGHAKVIADIVLKSGDELYGFLDDNLEIGTEIIHTKKINVIGKFSDCEKYRDEFEFIIAIGNNEARESISKSYDLNYYTAIHPNAVIAIDVEIGEGTEIMAGAIINSSTTIGKHVIINSGSVIEHDNYISDYVHISPNAVLAGRVTVGEKTHIGVGATVKNRINIGNNVLVGAGAVVVKDIEKSGTYIGIPAREM